MPEGVVFGAGGVSSREIRQDVIVKDFVYDIQGLVGPGHDIVLPFYIPDETRTIEYVLMNVYFPGLQAADYPMNSAITYLPYIGAGSAWYRNGAFVEFENNGRLVGGRGAGGGYYFWYRTFMRFNISPIVGFLLSKAELRWTLHYLGTLGSGPNTQLPLKLEATADYGNLEASDWLLPAEASYGNVNLYNDTVGNAFSSDIKTRIQAQADAQTPYSCFRFLSDDVTDVVNANNYHLGDPMIYCELAEDTTATVNLYPDNGGGWGNRLVYFAADTELFNLKPYFSGSGKKRLKFTSSRIRRVDILLRFGVRVRTKEGT